MFPVQGAEKKWVYMPIAIPFPVSTTRVRIRPAIIEDMPQWADLYRNEERRTFLKGPIDRSPEEWWRLQCELRETKKVLTIETLDGVFVGVCGYLFTSMPTDEMEVWLMIAKNVEGNGIGKEVVSTLVNMAFQNYGIKAIIAVVDPENARSVGLISQLGFKLRGTHAEGWQQGHPVYSVTSQDFLRT